jgi:hypothetical protein
VKEEKKQEEKPEPKKAFGEMFSKSKAIKKSTGPRLFYNIKVKVPLYLSS